MNSFSELGPYALSLILIKKRQMNKGIFLKMAGVALLMCACVKEEGVNPLLSETELIPLSMGKAYTFRQVAYDENGDVTVDRTLTDVVDKDTLINGEKWFRFAGKENYATNRADGYYTFLTAVEKELFIFKYPVEKGNSFDSQVYIYNPEANESDKTTQGVRNVTVVSTNATVKSPISGKVFEHCIHYKVPKFTPTNKVNTRIYPSEQYIIPGVGQVLNIDYFDEDFKKIRFIIEQQL